MCLASSNSGLGELGYVEGRNIAMEIRHAMDHPERFRHLAAELVGLGVDVIVAGGTLATRAAKEATSTIPIVMVSVGDAVRAGLIKSLAQPGGNITGQSFLGPELALKGLDLLTEALPRAKRLAVFFNPDITPEPVAFQALAPAAKAKGVTLKPVELRGADDLKTALAAMGQPRPTGLLVMALSASLQNGIVEFAAKNRLPALYGFREVVDAGGLMSFGAKLPDLWRGAANYVDLPMILVDANLLLYAYHPRSEQHDASRAWLEGALSGSELVRFAWLTLWAFLRSSTNPRAFERPLTVPEAEAAVASWLSQPPAGILEPGDRHWDILRGLMREGQTVGPLIMDAVLAAIAVEHGATLHTTDRDFSRFPGLRWRNPLVPG